MQKLAREDGIVPQVSHATAVSQAPASANCMLTNMFDPDEETEPGWDSEIKADVEAECAKYGTIEHIYVDKNTKVYTSFVFESSASSHSSRAMYI